MIDNAPKQARLILLDFIRLGCALLIFLRHAIRMGGIVIAHTDAILATTQPVMICFFMLSGFSLFLSSGSVDLLNFEQTKKFYIKRAIAILPAYLFVGLVYSFIYNKDLVLALKLQPVEFTLTQSTYTSLFGILHNGGTWFVGCLAISYLVFPLLQSFVIRLKLRGRLIGLAVSLALIIYRIKVTGWFSTASLYDSPFARLEQFVAGVFLAAVYMSIMKKVEKAEETSRTTGIVMNIVSVVGAAAVAVFWWKKWGSENVRMYWVYPLICLGIFFAAFFRAPKLDNRVLRFAVKLCYPIFLLQLVLWRPFFWFADKLSVTTDRGKLALALVLLLAMSVLTNLLIEQPIQKLLRKKLLGAR